MNLMLHRGGWRASLADLAAATVPEPTSSYHPVPYGRFVEEIKLHVPRFGLTVRDEAYALAAQAATTPEPSADGAIPQPERELVGATA